MPLILFWATEVVSAILIVLVFVAPFLDNWRKRSEPRPQWLALFAGDRAVRRTAVASAIGMAVTGCVFFRPPGRSLPRPGRPAEPPPPPDIIGA